MRTASNPRQRTLSFKITKEVEKLLLDIRVKIWQRTEKDVTKTDVVEAAIRLLADKEGVKCPKTIRASRLT